MVRSHRLVLTALFVAIIFVVQRPLGAQCQTWKSGFHLPGTNGEIDALVQFDDGSGACVFAGGQFSTAGPIAANRIAKWNGSSWGSLGPGLDAPVNALAVHDSGTGPALYAGGSFNMAGTTAVNHIARWKNSTWSSVGGGTNSTVYAFASFDDGSGLALFAGGSFNFAGSTGAPFVAKWDGTSWSSLAGGFNHYVYALQVFDDGTGPALYAAGLFSAAGATQLGRIAKWDGTNWLPLGVGLNGEVSTLAVFDDGNGPALYAGGTFTTAGGLIAQNIAKWNGSFWGPVGSGTNGPIWNLAVHDTGSGPALFAGGRFTTAGAVSATSIAKWDGNAWSALTSGVGPDPADVRALCTASLNGQSQLVVGGRFQYASQRGASNLATWNGQVWGGVPGHGFSGGTILGLATADTGLGTALYAAGNFKVAGTAAALGIAKWDGNTWSALGSGITGNVWGIAGTSQAPIAGLFAGGSISAAGGVVVQNIARWNGTQWSGVGNGLNGFVQSLATFDDGSGPRVFAGGVFVDWPGVVQWDGSSWSAAGSDFTYVQAVRVLNLGAGPSLYACGNFAQPPNSSGVARWNGSTWDRIGQGPTFPVDITACDDGAGLTLFACGFGYVSRFNGSTWQTVGGMDGEVLGLGVLRTASSQRLYAVGPFSTADGNLARGVAFWNGQNWTGAGGIGSQPRAVASFDDGLGYGADLHIGGALSNIGPISAEFGEMQGCGLTAVPFCFGDGLDPIVNIPCPCVPPNTVPNPPAAPGHGCANSLNLGGAQLIATGTTSPDTLKFRTFVSPNFSAFAFMMKGSDVVPTGVAGSDGIRCASGAILRFGGHMAGTNGSPFGQWTYPNTVQTQPVSMITSQPMGQSAYYQLYYRNSAANFCNAATANFSNAYQVVWQ